MNREELLKIANARLYPSLRNPNYLVLRSRRMIFAPYLKGLPSGITVLDVGGRYQPYRPLLEGKVNRYFALDVERTELITAIGSGEDIPFKAETFDVIIATGVFEYFHQPYQAAREMHRVLKPGGSLFVSVAATAPRFVDQERWRYLPLGLKSMFSEFKEVTIVPEVHSLGGFCRLINLGLHDFLKLNLLKFAYELTFCPAINLLGRFLEGARLTTNDKWAGNYSVIAVK